MQNLVIGSLATGQKPKSFLTGGSLLGDISLHLENVAEVISFSLSGKRYLALELGKKVNAAGRDENIGGGGGNAAYTLALQGNEVATMGVVGDDFLGKSIIDFFTKYGIDCSRVRLTPKHKTGLSFIPLPKEGNPPIASDRDASNHINLINTNLDNSGYDWLYLSGFSGNFKVLSKIMKSAQKNGIKVFFNPSKAELEHRQEFCELLKYVDIVSINSDEAALVVDGFDIEQRIRNLRYLVKSVAIITDGENGAYAATSTKVYHAPIYDNVTIVSTVGAGDAHNAAFLSAFANGKSVWYALVWAAANATSVLTRSDAKSGALKKGTKLHDLAIKTSDF